MSTNPNAVSPLRRRMIEDMTIRRFTEKTQGDYIRHVRAFAAFLGRSPELAEPENLRRFQRHMAAGGARPATMNAACRPCGSSSRSRSAARVSVRVWPRRARPSASPWC